MPLTCSWLAISLRQRDVAHDLVLGHFDDAGRASAPTCGRYSLTSARIGSLSSTLTGTLMARCRLKPASSNIDQSHSVATSACCGEFGDAVLVDVGQEAAGQQHAELGWRMRASASAPARHLRLRSIFGWYQISNQFLRSASSISIRGRVLGDQSH